MYTDTDLVSWVGSLDSCGFGVDVVSGALLASGVAAADAPGAVDVCGVTVSWEPDFLTTTFTTPTLRFLSFLDTSLTVILAVPTATALTFPLEDTVATFFLFEVKV